LLKLTQVFDESGSLIVLAAQNDAYYVVSARDGAQVW